MYGCTSFAARQLSSHLRGKKESKVERVLREFGRSTFHRMTSGRLDGTWRRPDVCSVKGPPSKDAATPINQKYDAVDFEATAELTEIFNERL
jgi:hypothetical protein